MTTPKNMDGVWFVYDGDCPVCNMAAEALQIKKSCGALHLLDARKETNHPLYREIQRRQFDLDEGMVLYHQSNYFHGADALHFMAVYGAPSGFFNSVNRLMFRSKRLAKALYPSMRGCRNLLLRMKGIKPIQNLLEKNIPTFKPIFGAAWESMPPVMHMHYRNRPFSKDHTHVEGTMSVWAAWPLRFMAPLLQLMGSVPTRTGTDMPVSVDFKSEADSTAFHFIRTFRYPGRKPYIFHSRMHPLGGSRVVERMKFGLGWRVAFTWENKRVILQHQGYAFCLFNWFIPLPLGWILGDIHAEEWETGANSFAMFVEIKHPLWGKIYDYRGEFSEVGPNG
jgi:predicted DCC family thiol-disulfide oxidoreductase YuxK